MCDMNHGANKDTQFDMKLAGMDVENRNLGCPIPHSLGSRMDSRTFSNHRRIYDGFLSPQSESYNE